MYLSDVLILKSKGRFGIFSTVKNSIDLGALWSWIRILVISLTQIYKFHCWCSVAHTLASLLCWEKLFLQYLSHYMEHAWELDPFLESHLPPIPLTESLLIMPIRKLMPILVSVSFKVIFCYIGSLLCVTNDSFIGYFVAYSVLFVT